MENLYIPSKIKSFIDNKTYNIDNIGMSGSQVLIFEDMVLKIQDNSCFVQNEVDIMQWLENNKPSFEPVFSHGDFCLPNIFMDNGYLKGFIDLGRAGIGDKWNDIALCYRSLKHNFDGTYGGKVYKEFKPEMLFEKLGIDPEWDKINYYLLLDELV